LWMSAITAGKKTRASFAMPFYAKNDRFTKMRQARDKYRKNSPKKTRFCRASHTCLCTAALRNRAVGHQL
jgi:hypothetical protein